VKRLRAHLALTAFLSLAASWLLWKNLLDPVPPVPIAPAPPTPRLIVHHPPAITNEIQSLPSPLILNGPFDQVIDQLRTAAHLNIWVNYRAMAAAGIPKDTPISLDASGQTLDVVFNSLLAQACTPNTTLICTIRGRLIDINVRTPPPASEIIVAIHDVRDLVGRSPSARQKPQAQALMNRIKTTIDPKSWDNRGGDGDIHFMGGQLVVRQNKQNLRAVASLLHELHLRHQLRIFTLRTVTLLTCSLLFVTLTHLLLNLYRRKSRLASSLCPFCGYDLRASPTLCPECGKYSPLATVQSPATIPQ
jgi:hypothetical protein